MEIDEWNLLEIKDILRISLINAWAIQYNLSKFYPQDKCWNLPSLLSPLRCLQMYIKVKWSWLHLKKKPDKVSPDICGKLADMI